jgi:hypothetical protein
MAKATPPLQPAPKKPGDNDTPKQLPDETIVTTEDGEGEEDPTDPPGGTRPVKPPPTP